MIWDVDFLPEADRDLDELAHSQQVIVKKAIKKVCQNPLPANEGGYGKPLGNKRGLNLTNLLKIKLLKEGINKSRQLNKLIFRHPCAFRRFLDSDQFVTNHIR